MSDSFDPDAWPSAGGAGGSGDKKGSSSNSSSGFNDDPYDTFDFDDDISTTGSGSKSGASNDDFNFNFDDFDEPTRQQKPSPVATSRRDDGDDDDDPYGDDPYSTVGAGKADSGYGDDFDDDYGSDYGNDQYDDEFDQFDREPQGGGDGKRKLIAAAAVVFLLGAVGFGAVTFFGGDDGQTAQAPTDQQQAQNQPQAQAPEQPQSQTPAPAANQAVPEDVVKAANDGLASWGRFAINGDLTEVQPYFVKDGPQYDRFETEANDIKSKAVGGAAMEMKMSDPQGTQVGNDWLVRGSVSVTRPGEQAQNFPWELRMTRQSDRSPWQILTVRQY